MNYDNFTFGGCKVDKPAPAHGKRRAEVEEMCKDVQFFDFAMGLVADLADEIDTLTTENERIRQNHGCTRHQHTTQFCAEAAAKDAVIGKLLELLKPPEMPDYECRLSYAFKVLDERDLLTPLYARALEIAGRTE